MRRASGQEGNNAVHLTGKPPAGATNFAVWLPGNGMRIHELLTNY
jgi:hypothetical protein